MVEIGGQSRETASAVAPGLDMARFAAASDATWPADEVERIGGWHLRLSEAEAGSRANSTWAVGPCGLPEGEAIDRVLAHYAAHDRRAVVQIWPGNEKLDAALGARGWATYDHCLILARPACGDWPAGGEGTMAVRVDARLAMAERLWAEGGVGPARQAMFHAAPGAKALFLGRLGMMPAGMVGVSLDGDVAVTQALWVSPQARGHGLGATLMVAVGRAAAALGARTIAHAVIADNAPARALYDRLGFVEIGRYHYRQAPA